MRRRLVWISLAVNATLLWLVAAACSGLQGDDSAWYDAENGCYDALESRLAERYADGAVDQVGEPAAVGASIRLTWVYGYFDDRPGPRGTVTCRLERDGDSARVTDVAVEVDP
ncbi:hypothetical protein H5V45_16240 [Nocardioides sp. KIGAM211]|uniref:Lipoprotein n=1 Tax=Nocardioides luti TaxID=2761101 RepID=A0A7X0RKQ1_9ACTN|nr:hypothetical protein [Nocardioides luti]MBB6628879.1 hypothetical protein [Nocardioides luti]